MTMDKPELFPDTGIQILCQPVRGALRTTLSGSGWQYAKKMELDGTIRSIPWAQWQIVNDQCFLAVDTTIGERREGYIIEPDAAQSRPFVIEKLLDERGEPMANFPKFEFLLLTRFEAGPRDVHVVVDFGNSRTGAILAEPEGKVNTRLRMLPFELLNRYHLNAWIEGAYQFSPRNRWFSSRTCWAESPYQPPEEQHVTEHVDVTKWGRPTTEERTRVVIPRLFDDLSMARLGRETEDLMQLVRGDVLMAVSSPKRFLWADDLEWLDNRQWSRAVPFDNRKERRYFDRLGGRLLAYIDARDSDDLLQCTQPEAFTRKHTQPLEPHVPRSLMVAALYEILAQAYMYANSLPYRTITGDANRPRRIASLTLSYPSGMVFEERARFEAQARKAARIFFWTLGKQQGSEPKVHMRVDEATAAQLAYVWGELQMVGADPQRLFDILAHDHGPDPEAPLAETANDPAAMPELSSESPASAPAQAPEAADDDDEFQQFRSAAPPPSESEAPPPTAHPTVPPRPTNKNWRLACIDIGGGTTDLMIANYTYEWGAVRKIEYEMLHRDGISRAGDYLIKRLLERLIVPAFAAATRLGRDEVRFWFGEETPNNQRHRLLRSQWMNRLFVPLAQEYLECAVLEDSQTLVSHFYADGRKLIDPSVLESLESTINEAAGGIGLVNFQAEMNLRYDPLPFEEIVWDVFGVLLRDFCKRISQYKADVVLLAGQPTKLRAIQNMVRMFLPLSASRIIPMHNHFAGDWYPYQDPKQPGVITDPKSAVVVGAALEMVSNEVPLERTKFVARASRGKIQRYYWGLLAPRQPIIQSQDILFRPDEEQRTRKLLLEVNHAVIGRKLFPEDDAEAAPVYLLEVRSEHNGPIRVTVELERKPNPDAPTEELLVLKSVSGYVSGEDFPAVLDENVRLKTRTLGQETFFLDSGGLDDIRV